MPPRVAAFLSVAAALALGAVSCSSSAPSAAKQAAPSAAKQAAPSAAKQAKQRLYDGPIESLTYGDFLASNDLAAQATVVGNALTNVRNANGVSGFAPPKLTVALRDELRSSCPSPKLVTAIANVILADEPQWIDRSIDEPETTAPSLPSALPTYANGWPTQSDMSEPTAPGYGPTAKCADGTYSYSAHRQGTCSHHGGVAIWLN
jgi:hypothetical protein